MPTYNKYTDGGGFYIKARPPNAGNITYQIDPLAERILGDLGYDDGDNLPWEVLKPLRLADLVYTNGQGSSKEAPFPNRDSSELNSIEWEKIRDLIDRLLSTVDISEDMKNELLEYASQYDQGELGSGIRNYEEVYEDVLGLQQNGLEALITELWSLRGFEISPVNASSDEFYALVARHQYPYKSTHLILFQEIGSSSLSVSKFNDLRSDFAPQRTFLVDMGESENKISSEYNVTRIGGHSISLAVLQNIDEIDTIEVNPVESDSMDSESAVKDSDDISVELISFNESLDISSWSFHDDVELSRPVAFFEVHNKSDEVIRWDCGKGAEILGDDQFRYSGDPGNLHLQTPVFPSSWEKGSQKLQPNVRARGVAFFEELPEEVSAESIIYTQKYHKGEEATSGVVESKETFEFDVSDRDDEDTPWDGEVDWL